MIAGHWLVHLSLWRALHCFDWELCQNSLPYLNLPLSAVLCMYIFSVHTFKLSSDSPVIHISASTEILIDFQPVYFTLMFNFMPVNQRRFVYKWQLLVFTPLVSSVI